MTSTPTVSFEHDTFGVLEGLLDTRAALIQDRDPISLCLMVYANAGRPLTLEELALTCKTEFQDEVGGKDMVQALSRMVSQPVLVGPGLVEMSQNKEGKTTYGITNAGMAMLWDGVLARQSDGTLDKYGRVIALNKRLGAPDRVIETHDLYALTLLAMSRLKDQSGVTSKDVREVVEGWVKPTGVNAEVLDSERAHRSSMTRFQRKFHNMFSSHNNLEKDGLIEKSKTASGQESWTITEDGKAVLMTRTLKERRNLTLQMQAATLNQSMASHGLALQVLSSYAPHAKTEEEVNSFNGVIQMVAKLVREDKAQIEGIRDALATPDTVKANTPLAKPSRSK